MSDTKKSKIKRYALSILRIGIAALAMYLVSRGQDWDQIRYIFRNLNVVALFLALILLFINQSIVASRWYLLLRLQEIDIGLLAAMKLTFVGFFYNNFLPSSVGGDLLRAWYVTKHTPKRLEAVLSVFIDRIIGLSGLIFSAIIAYMLFPKTKGSEEFILTSRTDFSELVARYWWIIVLFIGGLGSILLIASLLPKGRRLVSLGYSYLITTGRHLLIKISKAVLLYFRRPFYMLGLLAMTLFCQTLFIFGLYIVGRELGITAGFVYYLVFIPISWVIGMLPVSIGGVGIMEGGLVWLFVHIAGAGSEKAFALALCQRLALFTVALPGMFIHIAGVHVPAEFSVDSEAGIN